ncbi:MULTISPECIES: hypothetical protein [unclassified Paenibacillus]|uniref:hypothetical protein n=1 Tax=unclassified Paenibacillus TaxID=185978 RepID=UPI00115F7E1B|nr:MULTISPECIES: hypothetical protein [unclassified Paenibacillus]
MIPAKSAIDSWYESLRQGEKGARERALLAVSHRRLLVSEFPGNQWHVYELCKAVYELAEIDRVDFNGASLAEKRSFISSLIPKVEDAALREGVHEYHISCQHDGRRMNWIVEDEQNKLLTVAEAAQISQDILCSFIEHKGLTAELQAYVAQFEFAQDGPAN